MFYTVKILFFVLLILQTVYATEEEEKQIQAVFKAIDSDASGDLSKEEFASFLDYASKSTEHEGLPSLNEGDIDILFKELDQKQSDDYLSLAEFQSLFLELPSSSSESTSFSERTGIDKDDQVEYVDRHGKKQTMSRKELEEKMAEQWDGLKMEDSEGKILSKIGAQKEKVNKKEALEEDSQLKRVVRISEWLLDELRLEGYVQEGKEEKVELVRVFSVNVFSPKDDKEIKEKEGELEEKATGSLLDKRWMNPSLSSAMLNRNHVLDAWLEPFFPSTVTLRLYLILSDDTHLMADVNLPISLSNASITLEPSFLEKIHFYTQVYVNQFLYIKPTILNIVTIIDDDIKDIVLEEGSENFSSREANLVHSLSSPFFVTEPSLHKKETLRDHPLSMVQRISPSPTLLTSNAPIMLLLVTIGVLLVSTSLLMDLVF